MVGERRFRDRTEAGMLMGQELARRVKPGDDPIVLALPRGGVPVGYEIARALDAPLDVFIVRKLGAPGHEELAMGAIASGGVLVWNEDVRRYLHGVPQRDIDAVVAHEQKELERREQSYRGARSPLELAGRTAIVVDDGLATGSTMRAAVRAIRKMNPRAIIVAVPVAASSTCAELRAEVDDIVCLRTPEPFTAVGLWYEDFTQTMDEEVHALLDASDPIAATAARKGGRG
jgi:predicted phosphoribosyltransferase